MNRFLIGLGLVSLLTTAAIAQTATQPVDPAAKPQLSVDTQIADSGQDDNQQGDGWFKRGHRGRHHNGGHGPDGPRGMGGPGGPSGGMMMGKGFGLMLANGQGLRINCGDEPMKQCIEAAQPLIDTLSKANAMPAIAPKTP